MNTKSITLTLPQDVVINLSRAEILCADLILDLCRLTSKRQASGAFYTCASQMWLATRLGVTREWVSKCVNKLQRYGIIQITHRRKENEKWKTNLYRIGPALKKGWKTAKQLFLLAKSRVKFSMECRVNSGAHIGTKKNISRKEIRSLRRFLNESSGKSFDEIMAHCLKRAASWTD